MRPDKKKKGSKGKGGNQQRQQENSGTSSCNTTDEVEVDTSHKTVDSSKQPVQQDSSSKSPAQLAEVTGATVSEPETTSNSAVTDVVEDTNRKKFSKRQVFSNWERYAEPVVAVVEDVDAVTDGIDFEKLLQNPASGDGHFIFKSEKLTAPPNNGNLFALDLKLLSSTLSSIPFYKQLDLPPSIFLASELAAMDKEAEIRALQMKSEEPKKLLSLLKESIQEECQIKTLPQTNDINNQISTKICLPENTDKLMPEIDLLMDLELEDTKSSQPENIVLSNSNVTAKVQTSCDFDQQSATQKSSIVSNTDVDLEILNTALDNLAVSESETQTSVCDDRPNISATSGEDLEAWLDSVLDD